MFFTPCRIQQNFKYLSNSHVNGIHLIKCKHENTSDAHEHPDRLVFTPVESSGQGGGGGGGGGGI